MRASKSMLFAVGLTSGVLLAHQIGATRIVSATASYHAAFGVIALVMLGLAASGTRVYIDRKNGDAKGSISRALILGALSIFVGLAITLLVVALPLGAASMALITATCLVALLSQFYFTGYAIAAILTDYANDVGRVYWADLFGAAIGALIVVPVLSSVTPILMAEFAAVLLCVAAIVVSRDLNDGWKKRSFAALAASVAVTVLTLVVPSIIELRRGVDDHAPIWTDWNHLSRVVVYEDTPGGVQFAQRMIQAGSTRTPAELSDFAGIGWGLSQKYQGDVPDTRYIVLDHNAGTPIIKDGAKAEALDILKWDVTALGYHVKPAERAFVIGGGGGRDVLAAQAFGTKNIDVVELNPGIVDMVQRDLADFSGKPYSDPNVNLVVGEARSELAQSQSNYDMIQMSMIDTWAASSSGAMVLTENALYTREAFDTYRNHLRPDGILSIARWYDIKTYGELGRLLSMVGDSLIRDGVAKPEDHVVVAYIQGAHGGLASNTLMKRSPFTAAEIAKVREICTQMGFTLVWPVPSGAASIDVPGLLRGQEPGDLQRLELEPATDDRPFFFNTYRPFGSYFAAIQDGDWKQVSPATALFALLFALAAFASHVFVLKPLSQNAPSEHQLSFPATLYFGCLGVGFLFVELALIQRLIMFLGHPTYALTTVLATLLLMSGFGSFLSGRIQTAVGIQRLTIGIAILVLFVAFGFPPILEHALGLDLVYRQIIAILLVSPVGVALGGMYPGGVRELVRIGEAATVPWTWAVNGVWGVLGSIAGMFIAMVWGYTALLLFGCVAYLVAGWAIHRFRPT